MLELDIKKKLGDFDLEVSFDTDSSVTALFGRSGAGKSSILNLIAGLTKPDQGHIKLDKKILYDDLSKTYLPAHKRGLGMVFQDARLFPHYDVKTNLTYGHWAGRREGHIEFSKVVDLLGLSALLDRKSQNLSGGEKQRVAIGRALLADPKLLLLDEPLASLDIERKRSLLPFLKSVREVFRVPMVLVSHDPLDIYHLADHLVLIDQGRVIENGPVRSVFASQSMQNLLGERNQSAIIDADVIGYEDQYALTILSIGSLQFDASIRLHMDERLTSKSLKLLVHARDVALSCSKPEKSSLQNCIPVSIRDINVSGDAHMLISCDIAGQTLYSQITRKSFEELNLKVGNQVFALIKSVALT